MVDERERALIGQIHTIETKNKKLMEDYQEQMKNKQEALDNGNTDFQTIILAIDFTKKLKAKKELADDLDNFIKELSKVQSHIQTQYRIDGIDQLTTSIDDILKQANIVEKLQGNFSIITNMSWVIYIQSCTEQI